MCSARWAILRPALRVFMQWRICFWSASSSGGQLVVDICAFLLYTEGVRFFGKGGKGLLVSGMAVAPVRFPPPPWGGERFSQGGPTGEPRRLRRLSTSPAAPQAPTTQTPRGPRPNKKVILFSFWLAALCRSAPRGGAASAGQRGQLLKQNATPKGGSGFCLRSKIKQNKNFV